MAWTHSLRELALAVGAAAPESEAVFHSVSTDTRTLAPGDVFFALRGERFDGNRFVAEAFAKGACAAVTNEADPTGTCIVVKDPLHALQSFAACHRQRYSIPVFAVTGSCGKTMAKDLTAAVLASKHRVVKTHSNLNNEIGCPLSLLCVGDDTQIMVVEMGANHAGEIARLCVIARPTESAITMIAPAHLEGFGSIERVAEAKAEIVAGLPEDGIFYVNVDDARCVKIAESHRGRCMFFGSAGDVTLRSCRFSEAGEMLLDIDPVGELRLPLVCRAHTTNVLLAVAVGITHDVTRFEEPLREAIADSTRFRLLQVGPLEIIDDTYNANPASMAAALRTLAERPGAGARMAVLGEMLELGDAAAELHQEVGRLAGGLGVAYLFACGPHAADMAAAARAAHVAHAEVFDEHEAIAEAVASVARAGDKVLMKGSRGMRMERVIEALQRRYS